MRHAPSLTLALCTLLIASGSALAANRSTIRQHDVYSGNGSTNADDYNFIGVQGSLGLAHASVSDPGLSSGMRVRGMFGAYYERRFIPYLGARAGLDFNMRGLTLKNNAGANNDYSFNYLEIPVLLKAQIPTRIVTPFVAVGPFFGFAVGKNNTVNQAQGASVDDPTIDQQVNTFNFGLDFGAGVDFQIVRHLNVEVGARYSLGLTNILNTQGQQALGGDIVDAQGGRTSQSIKLSDMQFLAGLSYSI